MYGKPSFYFHFLFSKNFHQNSATSCCTLALATYIHDIFLANVNFSQQAHFKFLKLHNVLGTRGKTERLCLKSWSNNFEAGHTDEYAVEAMDVGEVLMIHLYNDGAHSWYKNPDWFVNKITVTSSKQPIAFEFPCYRWVVSDMTLIQGKGTIQKMPHPLKDHLYLFISLETKCKNTVRELAPGELTL